MLVRGMQPTLREDISFKATTMTGTGKLRSQSGKLLRDGLDIAKRPTINRSTTIMQLVENADDGNPYLHEEDDQMLRNRLAKMGKCLKWVSRETKSKADKARFDSSLAFVAQSVERLKARCGLIKDLLRKRCAKDRASRLKLSIATRGITVQDIERVKSFQVARKFGPRSGMRVSERYRRALKFDLDPPEGILEIVARWPEKLDAIDDGTLTFCDLADDGGDK
ncbi:hypothetical protein CYMTET_3854 [Cymbomonas tetramitiformis]|uniref:Uncharacterized protein n=1 Tax=Cymbomonas tetramitiformis TaxID=36881 RepID=A0AAE0H453_9CHLO|nr:hypothetical protein CYMTET_3854 [Cymbomonas tetramitiformis]